MNSIFRRARAASPDLSDCLFRPTIIPFSRETKQTSKFNDNSASLFLQRKEMYKILSLDGGGVRGILTTVLLKRLVEAVPDFMDNVDLIAGSSTGGLITLLLAAGYSPNDALEIYHWSIPYVFETDRFRLWNPFISRYNDRQKEVIFREFLGDRKLGDIKKQCMVLAFRLTRSDSSISSFFGTSSWKPAVFTNMPRLAGIVDPDNDLMLYKAAMRTSAAPTIFPIYEGYCDGAVVSNNPSMIAVAKACMHYPSVTPSNVVVMSLGCGTWERSINLKDKEKEKFGDNRSNISSSTSRDRDSSGSVPWGLRQWGPYVIDLLLDGSSLTVELMTQSLFGNDHHRYHRLDPDMGQAISIDDVKRMHDLVEIGNKVDLTSTIEFAREYFSKAKKTKSTGPAPDYSQHETVSVSSAFVPTSAGSKKVVEDSFASAIKRKVKTDISPLEASYQTMDHDFKHEGNEFLSDWKKKSKKLAV